ncbi:MAG: hypothetical protein HQL20_01825 [Candidatus Omnitrophica bacterium]|nr:hypothetical protein [Candidatus Omnitrophota bacterium]
MKDSVFSVDGFGKTGASSRDIKFVKDITQLLQYFDPLQKTYFEYSFKVRPSGLDPAVRVLNIDGNGYSNSSPNLFQARLDIFSAILKRFSNNKKAAGIVRALRKAAAFPMDLYFGVDSLAGQPTFAFWLVFGGVKRDGKLNYVRYDVPAIMRELLQAAGMVVPVIGRARVLNFGFDVGPDECFYKLYYLCDKASVSAGWGAVIGRIKKEMEGVKLFIFRSELFDREGKLRKEKLFVEFLEDIPLSSRAALNELMPGLFAVAGTQGHLPASCRAAAMRGLKAIGGRLALASFEQDGTITFYIRPQ